MFFSVVVGRFRSTQPHDIDPLQVFPRPCCCWCGFIWYSSNDTRLHVLSRNRVFRFLTTFPRCFPRFAPLAPTKAFATDAVKTTGQATSPAGVFGVTIEALSGAFLKTRVVTVWPRFVVRNDLGREVGVLPTKEPPPKSGSDLGQSGRRLTKVSFWVTVVLF